MPKFFGGKVTLVTWEMEAESREAAEKAIAQAENPLNEEPNAEIKRTVHKFGWFEFDVHDPTGPRDEVLVKFLTLIKSLPGFPKIIDTSFQWDGKIKK
jgi:hypothetical protein